MKAIFQILVFLLLVIGCKEKNPERNLTEQQIKFNQGLVDKLLEMVEIDQVAVYAVPIKNYSHLSQIEWERFKDSVYKKHQKILDSIFAIYGFPGYDLIGKEGSQNFWLMAQHADHDPKFQQKVLKQMKIEVAKENADPVTYAKLTDRVNLNLGKRQIYGTQVTYNLQICQAYPKDLTDSIHVNKRRAEMGLEPIEKYLNEMSEIHFEMNKEYYKNLGITEPHLYKIKERAD